MKGEGREGRREGRRKERGREGGSKELQTQTPH